MATGLVKFGEAQDVKFGTPTFGTFVVVESISATHSYQTNNTFKNELGVSVGHVLTDPKIEVTISGIAEEQVATLGSTESLPNFVGAVEGGESSSLEGGDTEVVITSIKQDSSNEDFMKFELTGEAYADVKYGDKKVVTEPEF